MEKINIQNIKLLREDKDLNQKDIAMVLNIDRTTYTSYEIGRDTIPLKHLNTLCNYFDISVDYALGLNKHKNYPKMRPSIDAKLMAERLKELRKEQKLTQMKMAKVLNTSRSTWTGYEYGHYQISTTLLFGLASKYHRSMDYLLGKIDDKNALK